MSKKLFLIVAVVMIAATVLSACAPKAAEPKADDCSTAELFCVGLVTDVGKVDDKSFNQSTWEGVKQAEKDLGAKVKYIETTDSKDYDKNIATFADAKYDVVVTVGFALGEAAIKAAKKYPDVKFIGVDQFQSETIGNLTGLIFDEDKAGFLAGALAALVSKSKKIGAALATDAVPPVWRFGEGYRAGAKYADPSVEINIVYHNDVGIDKTFVDPEWGKTTTVSMIDKGVDIVFGAGGKTGNGGLIGGAEKGIMVIGVDTDQYFTVPEAQKALLSSAMKLLTPGTFNLIKMAKEGKFPGGNFAGEVGLAPFHDLDGKVSADIKTKIETINKGLMDGSIKTDVPPTKPQ